MGRIIPGVLVGGLIVAGAMAQDGFTPEQRQRMKNWKPRTAAEQKAIMERGDRYTWKTSGRSGSLGVSGCASNWKPGDYGYDPAKHGCGSSSSGSGGISGVSSGSISGSSSGSGGGVIAAAPRPWKQRLEEARAQVQDIPEDQLEEALGEVSGAHIFAVLERAYRAGVALPEPALAEALGRSQDPQAAYAAAFQLAGHRTLSARDTLARHVARGAAGHRKILGLLGPEAEALVATARDQVARRQGWMEDAATGRPGSRSQLEAIENLVGEPGGDVDALLQQLSRDSHETVSAAAAAALEKRREAGL